MEKSDFAKKSFVIFTPDRKFGVISDVWQERPFLRGKKMDVFQSFYTSTRVIKNIHSQTAQSRSLHRFSRPINNEWGFIPSGVEAGNKKTLDLSEC